MAGPGLGLCVLTLSPLKSESLVISGGLWSLFTPDLFTVSAN